MTTFYAKTHVKIQAMLKNNVFYAKLDFGKKVKVFKIIKKLSITIAGPSLSFEQNEFRQALLKLPI